MTNDEMSFLFVIRHSSLGPYALPRSRDRIQNRFGPSRVESVAGANCQAGSHRSTIGDPW